MNIGIIDCGGANLNSIYYSFKRLGINAIISNSVNELSEMNAYVLPGVGSADVVMDTLRKKNLIKTNSRNQTLKIKRKNSVLQIIQIILIKNHQMI